ncbi:putative toxin-antitoxin system toxin component, PIN family [Roseivirga sp.]|uniref:putative toxin-antitoxin system toxin component, PIN family n=1 Tax=Roseivirga sp. TaxID=1964215 RepID=UPI003B52900A
MSAKRAILDTNLWISFLISKNTLIETLLSTKKLQLVFSNELLDEFIEVAKRPKLKAYFTSNSVENLLRLFSEYAELIEVTSVINICRDYKDNFLLALAIDSQADFLVTGDNDLLVLKNIRDTEIISFAELIEKLKA